MRFTKITAAMAALCLALPTTAQKVRNYGGDGERANSTMVLFGEDLMAGIVISYGQPEWKEKDYADLDKMIEGYKGNLLRLGKNLWTTFMTNVPITIGGTKVEAGSYVVGMMLDKNGKFALALLDSTKAMKQGLMPFGPQKWTPDYLLPLELKKDVVKGVVTKMKISLKSDEQDPTTGTFQLVWGTHELTAPLKVHGAE